MLILRIPNEYHDDGFVLRMFARHGIDPAAHVNRILVEHTPDAVVRTFLDLPADLVDETTMLDIAATRGAPQIQLSVENRLARLEELNNLGEMETLDSGGNVIMRVLRRIRHPRGG